MDFLLVQMTGQFRLNDLLNRAEEPASNGGVQGGRHYLRHRDRSQQSQEVRRCRSSRQHLQPRNVIKKNKNKKPQNYL